MASESYFGSAQILSLFKPTIQLEEIAIKDVESQDQELTVSSDSAKPSKMVGHLAPYVKINGFVFDHHDILDMTLDESGFLPTINITIRDTQGIFKSAYFPKKRPVLSLYIRSIHDKLKCIRCDFLITEVMSDSSIDYENMLVGKNMELTLIGTLLVPEIYSNVPQSYADITSFNVLQKIAADMQLGFATNETYTNDKMTWIKPLIAKRDFMEHVIVRSFKDEKSFYIGFVDKYYHLNFINVASMLEETGDFNKIFEKIITYEDLSKSQKDEEDSDDKTSDLILTNYSKAAKSSIFITEHRPESSQGRLLAKSGYMRTISYYSQGLKKEPKDCIVSLDVKPMSTTQEPNTENNTNDSMKTMASNLSYGEWAGVDYGNEHDNFHYAQILNAHNNENIRKITLYIRLDGINLNLIRGMRVPVALLRENIGDNIDANSMIMDKDRPKDGTEQREDMQLMKDKWLSGYYFVGSLTYSYDAQNGFSTEATLLRMNWAEPEADIPSKTKST